MYVPAMISKHASTSMVKRIREMTQKDQCWQQTVTKLMQSPSFVQGTQTIQAPESQRVSGIVRDESPFFTILS